MSVIISKNLLATPALQDQPLTHARIMYDNIITATNYTASTAQAGYPASNFLNPATFERYAPTGTSATITVDAGAIVSVDCVAILAKSCDTIKAEYSEDNIAWSTAGDVSSPGDGVTMLVFETLQYRYWRVTLTGAGMQVANLRIGKALSMQRAIYGGHSPITLSRITSVRPNVSETGQFIGSTVQRSGYRASYQWQNLEPDWYRANFDPFVATNPKASPFFIAWRPSSYPSECAYVWATDDIAPQNMGVRGLMSVQMNVEGFAFE